VPNVNVLDDLETRLTRLSEDEKRLFALVCRSYLAAVMPDYEYRQTVVTMSVPVPNSAAAEFRAVGRIPLRLGWKAVYQPVDPDVEAEAEQTLPSLSDGETAIPSDRGRAERTNRHPATMKAPWWTPCRTLGASSKIRPRERLKEAKALAPCDRAEIIKGLKRQNLLAADGKLVLPTPAGLQLFELLRGAAPALVDPGTTALWEMRLDEVVTGRADFRAVIDGIAAVALELINALLGRSSGTVDLTLSTSTLRSGRRRPGRQAGNPTNLKDSKPVRRRRGTKAGQASTRKHAAAAIRGSKEEDKPCPTAPTPKMVAYAQSLARGKKVTLPEGYERDFKACRRFLDEHAR
jgi:DNA topoisomerase-3